VHDFYSVGTNWGSLAVASVGQNGNRDLKISSVNLGDAKLYVIGGLRRFENDQSNDTFNICVVKRASKERDAVLGLLEDHT
jgi:hypothetical protein